MRNGSRMGTIVRGKKEIPVKPSISVEESGLMVSLS